MDGFRVGTSSRYPALMGFGCDPVLVTATKKHLLKWIGAGLRQHRIAVTEADSLPL
jgi:hypothetical protein